MKTFLEFTLFSIKDYSLTVFELVTVLIIFIITYFLLWIIKKALFSRRNTNKLDTGNTYALFKIIKYFVWIGSIGLMLETTGL